MLMPSLLRIWTRPIIWMLLSCALVLQASSLWSAFNHSTPSHDCHLASDVATIAKAPPIDVAHHCLIWCMGTAAHVPVRVILPLLITLDHLLAPSVQPALVAWQTAPPIRPPI